MFIIILIVGGYFGYDYYINKGKIKRDASLPVVTELPSFETNYTVSSAYNAIPHRRTVFESDEILTEDENYYLGTILDTIDQAIVLRITAFKSLSGEEKYTIDNVGTDYQTLLGYVNSLEVPQGLGGFHERIYDAISLQGKGLLAWQSRGFDFKYHGSEFVNSPIIKNSSKEIKAARVILSKKYPAVSTSTKNAFDDYLGALDFKK